MYLAVYLTRPDGSQIKAGEIVTSDPDPRHGGALQGEFRYTPEYLSSEHAFPLDPVTLPLDDRIFVAHHPRSGVHPVFEDSLPDDWGRELLVRRYHLSRNAQRVPQLLSCIGQSALGALSYFHQDSSETEENSTGLLTDLSTLLQAAERYERGQQQKNEALQLLFQAGSSPGGARPKALIEDGGIGWIAKFPSTRDHYDVVRLEAATLELGRRAGLTIPDFKLIELGERVALLVRRFDLTDGAGRRHLISMKTLMQADNYYIHSYSDIADTVRCCSDHPQEDLEAVYRWMVFNAAIGNTDDHLKNIMMQHDNNGWCVTPFYDLLPNIHQNMEHVLMFDTTFYAPGRAGLLKIAVKFGLSKMKANAIVEAVWDVLLDWETLFSAYAVPNEDIARLHKDISNRLTA